MMDNTIHILDKNSQSYVDVFVPLMIEVGRTTLIPEIYDVFGSEHFIKFLDVFAGTSVEVPSRNVIATVAMKAHIYVSLQNKSETVASLAKHYELDPKTIERMRDVVAEVLAKGGGAHGSNGDGQAIGPSIAIAK
jgi:hypothetical protein